MKRQPPEREEILANHISDNELISKRTQLQKKEKKKQCDWKTGKEWNKYFSKKDIERQSTGTWKGTQHHLSSGKWKSKSQDIT